MIQEALSQAQIFITQPVTAICGMVFTMLDKGTISGTVTKTNSSTEDPIAGITVSAFPTYYFPEMMKDGKMSGGMKDMSIVKKDNGLAMQRINPSKIKKEKAR